MGDCEREKSCKRLLGSSGNSQSSACQEPCRATGSMANKGRAMVEQRSSRLMAGEGEGDVVCEGAKRPRCSLIANIATLTHFMLATRPPSRPTGKTRANLLLASLSCYLCAIFCCVRASMAIPERSR